MALDSTHSDADAEFEFARISSKAGGAAHIPVQQVEVVDNQHHDEAFVVSEESDDTQGGDGAGALASKSGTAAATASHTTISAAAVGNVSETAPASAAAAAHQAPELHHRPPARIEHLDNAATVPSATKKHHHSHKSRTGAATAGALGGGQGKPTEVDSSTSGSSSGSSSDEDDAQKVRTGHAAARRRKMQELMYNPAAYAHLNVTDDVRELFSFIGNPAGGYDGNQDTHYTPSDIELDTPFRPFIPDLIPSVGEIDHFIKVPMPPPQKLDKGKKEQPGATGEEQSEEPEEDGLGLVVLDEPNTQQSDPTVLDLQLRVVSKQSNTKPMKIRSIEDADKHPKKITQWLANLEKIHQDKPAPKVTYSRAMPDIEQLMQVWPTDFEEKVLKLKGGLDALPNAEIDLDISSFAKVVCALLDVPVHSGKLTESLHVVFTLFDVFENNVHFQGVAAAGQ